MIASLLSRRIAAFAAVSLLAVSAALAEPVTLDVAGLKFTAASGWKADPNPRPMRAGTLVRTDDAKIEAGFFHFGGGFGGGDVESNVKRWQGMFAPSPEPVTEREEIKVGEKAITLLTITGTYKGSSFQGPTEPLPDHVMLAAIVPGPEGNVFIRLTGAKAAVSAIKDDFKKLATSPHVK